MSGKYSWRRARRGFLALGFAVSVAYAFKPMRSMTPAPKLPDGVRYDASHWNASDWIREGYAEMVSPIRPPSSEDGQTRIAVFLRLPPSGLLRAVKVGESFSLELPSGTRSERVEFAGDGPRDSIPANTWRVLDVRGITFDGPNATLRVLRPKAGVPGELLGVSWERGVAQAAATLALGDLVLRAQVAAPAKADDRERAAARLRGLNDCPSCHTPHQGGRRSEKDVGIVNRGTDASGMFQVTSIFKSRLPFETYRPKDMNLDDPFMARYCGSVKVDPRTVRCPDGTLLEGELDVRGGLRAGDMHVQRVCSARRLLAENLDESGRAAFSASLAECSIAPR